MNCTDQALCKIIVFIYYLVHGFGDMPTFSSWLLEAYFAINFLASCISIVFCSQLSLSQNRPHKPIFFWLWWPTSCEPLLLIFISVVFIDLKMFYWSHLETFKHKCIKNGTFTSMKFKCWFLLSLCWVNSSVSVVLKYSGRWAKFNTVFSAYGI